MITCLNLTPTFLKFGKLSKFILDLLHIDPRFQFSEVYFVKVTLRWYLDTTQYRKNKL